MAKKKLSKGTKTALVLGGAIAAGVGAFFIADKATAADPKKPLEEPVEDVDEKDPTDLPPEIPEPDPDPKVVEDFSEVKNLPPPAPIWNPDLWYSEQINAVGTVNAFRSGELKISKPRVQAKLTDKAMQQNYPNAPKKIPENWEYAWGWQNWVDAWKRMYNYVGQALEDTEPK